MPLPHSQKSYKQRFYYSGQQMLHEVKWESSAETATHRWVYGPWIDEPLEYADIAANPDKFFYYYDDCLGSARVVANDAGIICESCRYSEWGGHATYDSTFAAISDPDLSPIGNRWTYAARQVEEDSAEAALFYRARHYQASLGRFLQRDPKPAHRSALQLYAYVQNMPVGRIDPFGEADFSYNVFHEGNNIGTLDFTGVTPPPLWNTTCFPWGYVDPEWVAENWDFCMRESDATCGLAQWRFTGTLPGQSGTGTSGGDYGPPPPFGPFAGSGGATLTLDPGGQVVGWTQYTVATTGNTLYLADGTTLILLRQ